VRSNRQKWRLSLDMIDEMTGLACDRRCWWPTPAPARTASSVRGLEDRAIRYVVQVACTETAYPERAAYRTTL